MFRVQSGLSAAHQLDLCEAGWRLLEVGLTSGLFVLLVLVPSLLCIISLEIEVVALIQISSGCGF